MHIKDLCTQCDHWTITTITHDGKIATFTCTHCKNEFDLPWNTVVLLVKAQRLHPRCFRRPVKRQRKEER